MSDEAGSDILHASAVALGGRGAMIRGAAGSGKSALCLELMAFGARLIADDRTRLRRRDAGLFASCPEEIAGLVEARGVGLLKTEALDEAPLHLVVDLDLSPEGRLPAPRSCVLLDCRLPLFAGAGVRGLGPAIVQLLKNGWVEVP